MASVQLHITGDAYCSMAFEPVYELAAAIVGHRPMFTVTKAFDRPGMLVTTTDEDAILVASIIKTIQDATPRKIKRTHEL